MIRNTSEDKFFTDFTAIVIAPLLTILFSSNSPERMDLPIEILFQIFAHVYPPNIKKERNVIPVLTARRRHDARGDVLSCSLVCKFCKFSGTVPKTVTITYLYVVY